MLDAVTRGLRTTEDSPADQAASARLESTSKRSQAKAAEAAPWARPQKAAENAAIPSLRRAMFDGNAGELASDKAEVWFYVPNGESFVGRRPDFSVLDGAGALQRDTRGFMRALYAEAALEKARRRWDLEPRKPYKASADVLEFLNSL